MENIFQKIGLGLPRDLSEERITPELLEQLRIKIEERRIGILKLAKSDSSVTKINDLFESLKDNEKLKQELMQVIEERQKTKELALEASRKQAFEDLYQKNPHRVVQEAKALDPLKTPRYTSNTANRSVGIRVKNAVRFYDERKEYEGGNLVEFVITLNQTDAEPYVQSFQSHMSLIEEMNQDPQFAKDVLEQVLTEQNLTQANEFCGGYIGEITYIDGKIQIAYDRECLSVAIDRQREREEKEAQEKISGR